MKIRTALIVAAAGGICVAGIGCSSARVSSCLEISPPEIHMTGEKTVIEKQIVGDYRELEKDAWIIASVRTNVQRSRAATASVIGDEALFRALKVREFHFMQLRNYKDEGAVGEAGTGFIAYMKTPKYEGDRELKKLLLVFIDEENRARKTIFQRSLAKSGRKTDEADEKKFGTLYAEEQRALSKNNDWIQEPSGQWTRKK